MYMKNLNLYSLITLILSIYPATTYPQDFYKWVDASGSTHYSATPPPSSAKKLGSVSTYSNSLEQTKKQLSDNKPVQNLNQPSLPVAPKDEFTTAERAEIEKQVKQQLQGIKKDPYAAMFGATNEKDIRRSMEVAYQQKKEKLANSRASNR